MSYLDAFTAIYGREPQPEDVAELNRLAEKLDLKPDQWPSVFYFRRHEELMRAGFARLEQTAEKTLEKVWSAGECGAVADATRQAAWVEVVGAAASNVANKAAGKALEDSVKDRVHTTAWWVIVTALAITVMLVVVGSLAYRSGWNSARDRAAAEMQDVRMAAAWSGTVYGQAAYQLWKSGGLEHLVDCDLAGWKIKREGTLGIVGRKYCEVGPQADGRALRWYLPKLPR